MLASHTFLTVLICGYPVQTMKAYANLQTISTTPGEEPQSSILGTIHWNSSTSKSILSLLAVCCPLYFPMPHALCSMLHAPCSMLHALRSMPYARMVSGKSLKPFIPLKSLRQLMSTDLSKLRGWREIPMKIVVFRIDSQLSPVFSF